MSREKNDIRPRTLELRPSDRKSRRVREAEAKRARSAEAIPDETIPFMPTIATQEELDEVRRKIAATQPDPVNHPAHYTSHPYRCACGRGIEAIDVSEAFSSNVGQAIQYAWRHLLKGEPVKDLRKAARFLEREADRLERAGAKA
jgi:hypothetical protein